MCTNFDCDLRHIYDVAKITLQCYYYPCGNIMCPFVHGDDTEKDNTLRNKRLRFFKIAKHYKELINDSKTPDHIKNDLIQKINELKDSIDRYISKK